MYHTGKIALQGRLQATQVYSVPKKGGVDQKGGIDTPVLPRNNLPHVPHGQHIPQTPGKHLPKSLFPRS